jgi:hypothetical protein
LFFKNWFAKILGGTLITILVTIFHIIVATPHFLFECVMYLVNKDQFRANMINLKNEADKKLLEFKNREKEIKKAKTVNYG